MAYHRKLFLPSFKVTKRSTSGDIVERNIPRGFSGEVEKRLRPEDTTGVRDGAGEDDLDYDQTVWASEPSPGPGLYEISQKANVSA